MTEVFSWQTCRTNASWKYSTIYQTTRTSWTQGERKTGTLTCQKRTLSGENSACFTLIISSWIPVRWRAIKWDGRHCTGDCQGQYPRLSRSVSQTVKVIITDCEGQYPGLSRSVSRTVKVSIPDWQGQYPGLSSSVSQTLKVSIQDWQGQYHILSRSVSQTVKVSIPENTRRSPNVCLMLGQRRRRRDNMWYSTLSILYNWLFFNAMNR